MDTFDHIQFDDTPEENLNQQEEPVAQEPDSGAYHNHGTGRKESPYADSPYEMHHSPRQEYHYRPQTQPPVKPKKEKKPRKGIWKGILAAGLALALIGGSCLATAAYMKNFYEDVIEEIYDYLHDEAESGDLATIMEDLRDDYDEQEVRLVRIKFLCEVAN